MFDEVEKDEEENEESAEFTPRLIIESIKQARERIRDKEPDSAAIGILDELITSLAE